MRCAVRYGARFEICFERPILTVKVIKHTPTHCRGVLGLCIASCIIGYSSNSTAAARGHDDVVNGIFDTCKTCLRTRNNYRLRNDQGNIHQCRNAVAIGRKSARFFVDIGSVPTWR